MKSNNSPTDPWAGEGDSVVARARKYDNDRFEALFGKYNELVFNRMITTCRDVFIRYIDIHDNKIPDLIDGAIPPEPEQLGREALSLPRCSTGSVTGVKTGSVLTPRPPN